MARITVTIPDQLVEDLDRVSSSLGYTRSALLTYFLGGPVHTLVSEFGGLGLPVPEGQRKRFMGVRSLEALDRLMDDMGCQVSEPYLYDGDID